MGATVGVDWKVVSGQAIPPYVDPEYDSYYRSGLGERSSNR
jgi:hypothetical protein